MSKQKKQWTRHGLQVLAVLMIASTVLAGCGGQQPKEQAAAPGKTGPTPISMMVTYYGTEPPKKDHPGIKQLQEYTNTQLEINWIPTAAYKDKLTASIAGNNLPQVVLIHQLPNDIRNAAIVNGVKSGMFWEIGPYLKDYKNLSKLNEGILNNTSYEGGKVFSLYRPRDVARAGIIYRKDWLDALGLKEPKTMDEVYNMIKAFATQDPDKNGKDDTFGVVGKKGMLEIAGALPAYYGAGNGWQEQDGKLIPTFHTQEYLDGLKFYKKLYAEKLINQDFAITETNQSKDIFKKGKAGVYFATAIDDAPGFQKELVKTVPGGKVDVVSRIQGPKGERVIASNGFNGIFMFPKSSVKTEAELKKILEFFDKMLDEKMVNLITLGVEGKHYHMENSQAVRSEEEAKLDLKDNFDFSQLSIVYIGDPRKIPLKATPLEEKVTKMLTENEKIAILDPSLPMESQTLAEKGGELEKIKMDAQLKFIIGELDENGWKKKLEEWNKAGGDKLAAEYNTQYAQKKK